MAPQTLVIQTNMQHPTSHFRYPRTPYPLQPIRESSLEMHDPLSEWLDLGGDPENYPEYLSLSPIADNPIADNTTANSTPVDATTADDAIVNDAIRVNTTTDNAAATASEDSWLAGAPDWTEECCPTAEGPAAIVEDLDSSIDSSSSDTESSSLVDIDLLERAIAAESAAEGIANASLQSNDNPSISTADSTSCNSHHNVDIKMILRALGSDTTSIPWLSSNSPRQDISIERILRAIGLRSAAQGVANTSLQADDHLAVLNADPVSFSPPPVPKRQRTECVNSPSDRFITKRPRLQPLLTENDDPPVPHDEAEPAADCGPTPISPYHQFVHVLAERQTREGKLFKVCWRESWVHDDKMPDLEPVRLSQLERFGISWAVLPASPGIPELATV